MFKTGEELMASARQTLEGKWQNIVLATLVYVIVCCAAGSIHWIGPIIGIIIGGPMALGYLSLVLAVKRGGIVNVSRVFDGFSRFADAVVANLLMTIFVVLWSLLLVVPGVIAALGYSMTFFLMADDPSIDGVEAIRRSKQLMDGHKARLFRLCCRFTGWFLLAILTLGIGFFWLIPYFSVSVAAFYEEIRGTKADTGSDTAAQTRLPQ